MKTKIHKELEKGEGISIIDIVQYLVEYAHSKGASDVHIDPAEGHILVRLRVDGVLLSVFTFPKAIQQEIIARIKVLSGLRTDVHATSQDGRTRMSVKDGELIDVRVSVVPTYYGENAVLRILSQRVEHFSLDDMGMRETDVATLQKAVKKPFGMILVTGPTGSGKTTTLYTLLQMLNTQDRCLVTIEDPIEYSIQNIKQIQIQPATGFGFAQGLRAVLRQDPNVIMVGEIRDEETARIAVNTSLTGHLLFSTLHTNDAASTLPRLLDMKVDAYLIASTVSVVIAQRLVRRLCNACIRARDVTPSDLGVLGELIAERHLEKVTTLYEGAGCEECAGTGFKGRLGVYEIMKMDNEIKDAILRMASARELRLIAMKNGMRTMLEDGFSKAFAGQTTVEEVIRVIHE